MYQLYISGSSLNPQILPLPFFKVFEFRTRINLSYKIDRGLGTGGALCHEALSNSETKEPRIFEVTQLEFTIRAT